MEFFIAIAAVAAVTYLLRRKKVSSSLSLGSKPRDSAPTDKA